MKTTPELIAAAAALQSDLQERHDADATDKKKNVAYLGNALRAMNTITLKLNAQQEAESAPPK